MDLFLPDLQYCDRKGVINCLGVLVDDLMPEFAIKQSHTTQADKGLTAEMAKIAARYTSANSKVVEKEGIIRRPTQSLFTDLYQILKSRGAIQHLNGFDDAIVKQLRSGEWVELVGSFERSPVEASMDAVIRLMAIIQNAGFSLDMDSQSQAIMQLLKPKKATYIIKPFSDVEIKFVTSVDLVGTSNEEEVPFNPDEIEGEFTVFGRIRRLTPKGKTISLYNFLPGKMRFQTQKLLPLFDGFKGLEEAGIEIKGLSNLDESQIEVSGPVFEISPVAIYQSYS